MKFDKSLKYKTRDGRDAVYVGEHVSAPFGDPHVFNVFNSEGGVVRTVQVFPDGRFHDDREHDFDILPPKKTVYVNLYPNNAATHYTTEEQARSAAGPTALATAVPVEMDA